MEHILLITAVAVITILFARFELAQHKKTRKETQEIKTKLTFMKKRERR